MQLFLFEDIPTARATKRMWRPRVNVQPDSFASTLLGAIELHRQQLHRSSFSVGLGLALLASCADTTTVSTLREATFHSVAYGASKTFQTLSVSFFDCHILR